MTAQNISVSFFTSVTSEALAIRAGELDFTYIFSDPVRFAADSGGYGEPLRKLAVDVPYVPLFNLDEFIALGDKFTIPPGESSDNWDWVVNQWPFHIQAGG